MNRYYYQKTKKINRRIYLRILGLIIFIFGIFGTFYIFFPFISWQIYFAPILTSQNIAAPIPKATIVNSATIKSLFAQIPNNLNVDYNNANNWFSSFDPKSSEVKNLNNISSYSLSIPKINVENAIVSTTDHDLSKHLVNYIGTTIPPGKGNAVIFGHSTLPQLFKQNDYKTIFANLYKIEVGDEIFIKIRNISYLYKVYNIIITDPQDTAIFTQDYNNFFLTLVTCTPPGTTWKRLIVKTRLEKI